MAEDTKYLVDNIRATLKATLDPCYDNTSKTEIYCRCPNCGDSQNDRRKAHFYIQMKPPFKYYCQKCGFSGQLNQDVLNKLQVFDGTTILNINEANKNTPNVKIAHTKVEVDLNYKDEDNEISQAGLKYFNDRFKVNATLDEANTKFKCICNPYAFLTQNKIDISKSKFDFSKAIGFLSSDNKYLICRDITGKQAIRYSNQYLTQDDDKSKIYNIKLPINILTDEITLVITEGIFDCIGVYYKFYSEAQNGNIIIAAGCGKSYPQVIEKFIKMGFLNLKIEIYSDTDVSVKTFQELKESKYYLKNIPLTIYYNTLGKDCGTSADQINVTKTII